MPSLMRPVTPGQLDLQAPPTPEQLHRIRQGEYHKISVFYGDYPNLHFLAEGAEHVREIAIHADMGHGLQVLHDLPRLERLGLRGIDYAPGFNPVCLPALQWLCMTWHPDYPPLQAPALRTLMLYGPPAPDLGAIQAPLLRCLSVNGCWLQSTRGVQNFSQLEELWLMQQSRLEDLSGINQLHRLKKFTAQGGDQINWQPNPFRGLLQLREISILVHPRQVMFPDLHWLEHLQHLESFAADTRSTHLSWPGLFSLPRLHALAISVNIEAQPYWESELCTMARSCGRTVESLRCRERQGALHCHVQLEKTGAGG